MQQRDLGIILQKTQVYVVDLKTKQKKYPIGPKGAVQAETDGKVAVIVYPNGRSPFNTRRHRLLIRKTQSQNGSYGHYLTLLERCHKRLRTASQLPHWTG